MKSLLRSVLCALAIGTLASGVALAQIPRTISFQGILADASGNLLPNGTYNLTVSIYDQATGGSPLFSETHRVTVDRAVFNVVIGSSNGGIPTAVTFDKQYWLGVQVDNGTELSPRTEFTSVPYALNAAMAVRATSAGTADTAGFAARAIVADTASYIVGGYVSSVNGQQGAIEFLGTGATTVTRNGNQFIIRSTDTSGGGIRRIDNFDGSLVIDPPNGPFVTMFIREGGVQTYHLRDQAVTTPKIADQAVTNAKLAPLSISTDKIQDFAITNPKLGPDAVTTDKIMDGQVMTNDVADLNVTNAKIGPDAVTTDKIMDGQVMTNDIADLNVTNAKIGPDAVTTDKIMDGQVMTNDIADLNVTNAKIGPDAVTTDKIMDGQVQMADIADANVSLPKIDPMGAGALQAIVFDGANIVWGSPAPGGPAGGDLTGFYPNPEIAADAVTTAEILNGTILTEDLGANQVLAANIGTGPVGGPYEAAGLHLQTDGSATPVWTNDGSTLTNLNASNITTGTLDDARLSTNVALLNAANVFSGNNVFTGFNSFNGISGTFYGDGSNLTGLNASNITSGTLGDAYLSTNVALLNAANVFSGNNVFTGFNSFNAISGTYYGDGSNLTGLDATNIATGTLDDARLSANVALQNGANTFTGVNNFQAVTQFNNTVNGAVFNGTQFNGAHSGDGSLLTNVAAASLTMPFAQTATVASTMVSLTNSDLTNGTLSATADGGNAITGTSTNGAGVVGVSTNAAGVSGTSTNGYGVYASSTNTTALQAESNLAGVYAANLVGTVNASNALNVNSGSNGVGINMERGRFIGSYWSQASGGAIAPGRMVVEVADDGVGGSNSTVTLPTAGAGSENGRILILTTADPDGLTVSAGLATWTVSSTGASMFVKTASGWKQF